LAPLRFRSARSRWRVANRRSRDPASGDNLSKDRNLYPSYDKHGKLINPIPAYRPTSPSFVFPLMGVFVCRQPRRTRQGLTDPRIAMSLLTLLASVLALGLLRTPVRKKIRVAQLLLALPTGALFLSTAATTCRSSRSPCSASPRFNDDGTISRHQSRLGGGDEVDAWRWHRRALGRRDSKSRSDWKRIAAWVVAIVVVTVTPSRFAPVAFMSNVFAFPLGLTGVASPRRARCPGTF